MKFGGQPTPWSDEQIDGLRCRAVAQMLIEEIGADGPESAEDAAKRAVTVIQHLRQRIAALEAEKVEREAQEPVAWQWLTSGHFRKYFPPNDATRKDWRPLYAAPPIPRVEQEPVAHPLALREPTDDECREIADRFLCEVANAARGVRTGRAMFNAVREVMKK